MDESNELPVENEIVPLMGKEALFQFCGAAGEVIARYTRCSLCGANLHFSYVTDFTRSLTHETSKCPECGIKIREMMHRLQ